VADALPLNLDRLPTLTEVLELGREMPSAQPWISVAPAVSPEPEWVPVSEPVPVKELAPVAPAAPAAPRLDEAAIVEQVLLALQPRIDTLLESRVSEALAPALARAADMLIRESREELFGALRSLTEESLAQVLRKNGLHQPRDTGQG
jgi:hypothetical protein